MADILKKLEGGDLRSIGRSEEVVKDVLDNHSLFDALINGMLHQDPVMRMRSADAVEKITAKHPNLLYPYNDFLLNKAALIEQKEVRWHVAQILPRLVMTDTEVQIAVNILRSYLDDDSRIVRTFATDSLAYFAELDPTMEAWVVALIEDMVEDGTPAMKSRGRKLLARLKVIGKDT